MSPKFEYQRCNGIHINITDREKASPLLIVLHIIDIIHKIHPNDFKFNSNNYIDKLYGSDMLRKIILSNDDIGILFEDWNKDRIEFKKIREPFLLY